MNTHPFRITASTGTLARHLQESEQAQHITDRTDHHLLSYLKNIMLGDIQELFQEIADNQDLCQRIQVNVLNDITEVGRLVREALIKKFQRMAEKDARAEIDE